MNLEDQHHRLKVALRANGLCADGSLRECLERLIETKKKRKREGTNSSMTTILRMHEKILCEKLQTLPSTIVASIAQHLEVPFSGTPQEYEAVSHELLNR